MRLHTDSEQLPISGVNAEKRDETVDHQVSVLGGSPFDERLLRVEQNLAQVAFEAMHQMIQN